MESSGAKTLPIILRNASAHALLGFFLIVSLCRVKAPFVRILKTSIAVAAILATTHAFGTSPVSEISTPQAAQVEEQQETVNLAISGMT